MRRKHGKQTINNISYKNRNIKNISDLARVSIGGISYSYDDADIYGISKRGYINRSKGIRRYTGISNVNHANRHQNIFYLGE